MLLMCCGFTTCGPRPQEGGGATTTIPQQGDPNWEEGLPVLSMGMNQPENPEGPSSMESRTIRTTIKPNGDILVDQTETKTTIGGSQDYAKILKAWSQGEYFKGLVFAFFLFIGAWMAWKKEWPLIAACLAGGAVAGIFIAWWAGALAVLVSMGLYIGYKVALPISPTLT